MMSPWLFNVYMHGVLREVNARVHGKRLKMLFANGGKFEMKQLLFADHTLRGGVMSTGECVGTIYTNYKKVESEHR